jgi:hypothetical protein
VGSAAVRIDERRISSRMNTSKSGDETTPCANLPQ